LSNFEWTEASAYLFGEGDMLPAPTSYQSAVRIRGFANPGFGDSVPYLHYWGVELAGGTQQSDTIQPAVGAYWATGELEDAEMDNTLVITARVEEWGEDGSYEWSWGPETGDGVFIEGLDPSTTVVDLKIVVDNDGQTVTFYYRVNDDGAWQQATSHTLPEDTGTMYGAPTTSPVISLETGFDRAAPVYRFWNETYSRHFYTTDRAEKNKLITIYSYVWTYEGIKYYTYAEDSEPNSMPIYRFWSDSLSAHFYTIDEAERDKLINLYSHVWTYEGPCFYAFPDGSQPDDAIPVYRFWSDSLNCHFYTTKASERDKLINLYSHVWTYEGVAFYTRAPIS
ncbi:MAG TPA: hypothetical protein VJ553_06305, partial [Candidatus Paceibacterota bacterium]|nr:hypothetical protein [Candidatus Paceibacterota bacterium]